MDLIFLIISPYNKELCYLNKILLVGARNGEVNESGSFCGIVLRKVLFYCHFKK
jgi:hypothetical protein